MTRTEQTSRSGIPWVVLPTFNEAENVERMPAGIVSVLEQAAPAGFRVLIVDDESPDGTGQIADAMAANDGAIEVLHRKEREGLGPAYVAGFRHALARGAGYVLEIDADGSHDPADLARLLAAVRDGGGDLALGSRYVAGGGVADWGAIRRIVSRGGSGEARGAPGLAGGGPTGGLQWVWAGGLREGELAPGG